MKIYPYVLFSENVNYSPLYSDRQEASGEKKTYPHNFDEVVSISCGHFPLNGASLSSLILHCLFDYYLLDHHKPVKSVLFLYILKKVPVFKSTKVIIFLQFKINFIFFFYYYYIVLVIIL